MEKARGGGDAIVISPEMVGGWVLQLTSVDIGRRTEQVEMGPWKPPPSLTFLSLGCRIMRRRGCRLEAVSFLNKPLTGVA